VRVQRRPSQNPQNRFARLAVEYDDGEGPPPASVTLLEDASRSILSHNDSPDVGFSWSVNPYRGCLHACSYCYARPTHEYLDLGAGTDFDTKILVKRRAPELLREAFEAPSWKGELVVFSGVTDCYQAVERKLELTRGCLEVCLAYQNPVGIVTKSALVERDVELLAALGREADASARQWRFATIRRAVIAGVIETLSAQCPGRHDRACDPWLNAGSVERRRDAACGCCAAGRGRAGVRQGSCRGETRRRRAVSRFLASVGVRRNARMIAVA
jgi:hypothetical protein